MFLKEAKTLIPISGFMERNRTYVSRKLEDFPPVFLQLPKDLFVGACRVQQTGKYLQLVYNYLSQGFKYHNFL